MKSLRDLGVPLPPRRSDAPAAPAKASRAFDAAVSNRLTMDWITGPLSADAALSADLPPLRNRSRDHERNNEWVRGFLRVSENNVLGEFGITLQMRVQDPGGAFDEVANDVIEAAWRKWGKIGNCTLNRRQTWRDVQRIALRTMIRDGEVLLRLVVRKEGLRLQVLEPDHLDYDYHGISPEGNEIRFGVELDDDRAVVAYHLLGRHPGDMVYTARSQPGYKERIRVPASELIHLFIPDREEQTRGYPWLVASIKGLRMLDGYAEAELVAARTGAAKMGFLTKKLADGEPASEDSPGIIDAAPGSIEELPAGWDFKDWSPDHPNAGYGEFVKARLRGVATSLGISYTTLASDLEGVNYSSMRGGLLEERELWKALQRYLIDHLCEPIFSVWLVVEIMRGALNLPITKLWKFDNPEFTGRRWPWVDPEKDIKASLMAIEGGLTSRRKVIRENGGDVYDVFRDQEADNQLADQMGLTFVTQQPGKQGPKPTGTEEDN